MSSAVCDMHGGALVIGYILLFLFFINLCLLWGIFLYQNKASPASDLNIIPVYNLRGLLPKDTLETKTHWVLVK